MTSERNRPVAMLSWSGGKDCCLALLRARSDVRFVSALTMVNEEGTRTRGHGLRPEVVGAQVGALGLEWITRRCTWASYERAFLDALRQAAGRGVTHLVCGDITSPQHRRWTDRVAAEAGLQAVEPLSGEPTIDLYREFLHRGGVARIVAVDARTLQPEWLYRKLDDDALPEFARLGVDACGETGEYHTLVTSCSAFSHALALEPGAVVLRRGYWAIDVQVAAEPDGAPRDAPTHITGRVR